ncbi:MAG TPA: NDP-sugar synthase, partial [Polyangiaceae bacterium]
VGLGTGGNVVRLRGERFGTEVRGGNYLSIMAIAASVRAGLPSRGCLVADVALPLLRRGETIRAFPFDGEWDDVGLPDGLLRANLRWLERRATKAFCAADAAVAPGVTLERSVVSSGARVDGAGVLRECVVLPHGVVAAPAERTLAGRTARMAVV